MSSRLISLLGMSLLLISASAQETKKISLAITHPGFESKKAETHALDVKVDANGNPLAYFMNVKSVFCSDEKCDVITLSMEWNALGQFVGYKLPDGTSLTKYEHEPFEKADYAKFNQLMKNRGSLLAELDIKQIVVEQKDPDKNTKKGRKALPKDVAGKGDAIQKVDAVSGATPSYIQEEVVEGAAYTCYTMWHWAHGNTSQVIRAHSRKQANPEWLSGLLKSKSADEIDFALEALTERKFYKTTMQSLAKEAASNCSMNGFKILIDYLAVANPKKESRYSSYLQLMQSVDGQRRVQLLEHLLKQEEAPPISFFEQRAEELPKVERFYELQLFFILAEKHKAQSDKLHTAIAKMLEHDNFFFSRRAHAYLKGQELPAAVKTALESYEKEHADRL